MRTAHSKLDAYPESHAQALSFPATNRSVCSDPAAAVLAAGRTLADGRLPLAGPRPCGDARPPYVGPGRATGALDLAARPGKLIPDIPH